MVDALYTREERPELCMPQSSPMRTFYGSIGPLNMNGDKHDRLPVGIKWY